MATWVMVDIYVDSLFPFQYLALHYRKYDFAFQDLLSSLPAHETKTFANHLLGRNDREFVAWMDFLKMLELPLVPFHKDWDMSRRHLKQHYEVTYTMPRALLT